MFETPARIMKPREAIRALKNAGPQWLHKMEVFTYPPCTSESADRRLLVAVVAGNTDVNVRAFVDFLAEPSQNANAIAQD